MPNQSSALPEQDTPGYSHFASLITSPQDRSCMIFRRFDRVNARNLLILESEIAELETRLDGLERKGTGTAFATVMSDWGLLKSQADDHDDHIVNQMAKEMVELTLALDHALERYYKALSRTREVMTFSPPRHEDLQSTRRTSQRRGAKKMIKGAMRHRLDPIYDNDLSVIASDEDRDLLSRLLEKGCAYIFRNKSPLIIRSRVDYTVSVISALVAAIFLVVAIVALYFISIPVARLGTLCGFTIIFAATLACLTKAKRHEVFVATAAYAAVLVVFVSGNFAANNTTNYYPTSSVANPQPVNGIETLTIYATETVAVLTQTATAMATTTTTVSIDSIQTIYPTTCASPSPCATSAASRGGLKSLSTATKAGIGIGIACAGALVMVLLSAMAVWTCGFAVTIWAVFQKRCMSWFKRSE